MKYLMIEGIDYEGEFSDSIRMFKSKEEMKAFAEHRKSNRGIHKVDGHNFDYALLHEIVDGGVSNEYERVEY